MNEPLLSLKEIIFAAPHLAIALKSLPENKAKSLEELLVPAGRLLMEASDALETEWTKYMLRRNKEQGRLNQIMPEKEAIELFVPKEKDPALQLQRLNEFKEFMRNPLELAGDEYLEYLWQKHRLKIESGNWTYELARALKEYFPKWQKIKASRAQTSKEES